MKRSSLTALLLLLSLVLSSCALHAPLGNGTTAGGGSDPLPSLSALSDAIEKATPRESAATVTATYQDPAVTLTSTFAFTAEGERVFYTYCIERLLSVDAALSAGKPTETLTGHLTVIGDTLTDYSPEVTNDILMQLETITFRYPTLDCDFFTSLAIAQEQEGYSLSGEVKDSAVPMLFDQKTAGLSALTLTMLLDADLRPTETRITCRAADGAAVTYIATYRH